MPTDAHHDNAAELAALYSAGALTELEQSEFEARLREGSPIPVAEVAELSSAVTALADAVEPVDPPQRVRAALLARIDDAARGTSDTARGGAQVWRDWQSTDTKAEMVVVRAGEGAWEETGVKGVQIRRLFVDRARNQFTGLVRMAAGTAYPRHVHDGPEECLVLEGDLRVGDDTLLHAGDYQFAPPGSLHGIQSTRGGCLLLISSSLSDEMV